VVRSPRHLDCTVAVYTNSSLQDRYSKWTTVDLLKADNLTKTQLVWVAEVSSGLTLRCYQGLNNIMQSLATVIRNNWFDTEITVDFIHRNAQKLLTNTASTHQGYEFCLFLSLNLNKFHCRIFTDDYLLHQKARWNSTGNNFIHIFILCTLSFVPFVLLPPLQPFLEAA
jgi:hypothetical protein